MSFFTLAPTSGTNQVPNAGGNVFLDVLDRVANWDLTRRYGLPIELDGGRAQPVSLPAEQNAARTPPAPPGGVSAFRVQPETIALGAAAAVALIGAFLLVK